jgi:pantoate--beta-alanine ligase
MEIIDKIKEMQARSDALRREGKRIGFVPTMGALHEGHLSLFRLAKEKSDVVVASVFVNPKQFGPDEDYSRYPRDLENDKRYLEKAKCDILFSPDETEMYSSEYQSFVHVEELTDVLCGVFRPGHFRGVTTIVTKLFNIIKPHIVFFGQKDAQQAIIIHKMVQDLDFDIEIEVAPTVRESDGLAMSSRNEYLSKKERQKAALLFQSLSNARDAILGGERDSRQIIQMVREKILKNGGAKIDYVEVVDINTLQPVNPLRDEILVALAVWVGKTRLIDNLIVTVDS